MKKANKSVIKKRLLSFSAYRKKTQPVSLKSLGCVFQNPNNYPAGKLIDDAGLKSYSWGDAYVSRKHANFIINRGKAKARDVLSIIGVVRKRVYENFGVVLKPKIHIISDTQ